MPARRWIDRLLNWGAPARSTLPLTWDQYQGYFKFNGLAYQLGGQSTTYGDGKQEPPDPSFAGYASMLFKLNPVLFACAMVRLSLFSEARFQFRQLRSGRPGDLFGSAALAPLEKPWPSGTTGDLLARAIQDSDINGNAYFTRKGRYLRRMRPDWVGIVLGSDMEPDDPALALDAEVVGYVYQPGGSAGSSDPVFLLPEDVCHFAPIPDPIARYRGMSWLQSIIAELMADNAATAHKLKYFEQGATPNMAVTFDTPLIKTQEQFEEWVATFSRAHEGTANAFKTLFLSGGTSVQSIGGNMDQVDFKAIQGAGETRIAAAAGTPPVIVGLSEGLEGSSLNAGNYQQAFRRFADLTIRPLWRNFCGSMSDLIVVPASTELWYDDRDIPALKDDVKDAAEIMEIDARAIKGLVEAGFEPDSVVDAISAGDLKRLQHTGLLSVQMQEPGAGEPSSNGSEPIGAPV